jgi:hypothetical protein
MLVIGGPPVRGGGGIPQRIIVSSRSVLDVSVRNSFPAADFLSTPVHFVASPSQEQEDRA